MAVSKGVVVDWSCEQPSLRNRLNRQPLGNYPGTHPKGQIWWTTPHPGVAAGHQYNTLCDGRRDSVAIAAQRIPEMAKRI
jgi:hypothetical protein